MLIIKIDSITSVYILHPAWSGFMYLSPSAYFLTIHSLSSPFCSSVLAIELLNRPFLLTVVVIPPHFQLFPFRQTSIPALQ